MNDFFGWSRVSEEKPALYTSGNGKTFSTQQLVFTNEMIVHILA
jgi:hypothetical protein